MSDKQPQKRGRGRPPKDKSNNINTSINALLKIASTQPLQNSLNSLNSIIANQPDDIESLINHINDKELAMAIDESYASNLSMQINSSSIIKNNITGINSSFENINIEDDYTELAIIMAEIQEREEQERLDSELAIQLSKDLGNPIYEATSNNNEDNEQEDNEQEDNEQEDNEQEDNEQDEVADYDSLIRYNDSSINDENIVSSTSDIRKQQDFEYEQSLLKDIAKEEKRIKSHTNIKTQYNEKHKDDVKDNAKDTNEVSKPLTATDLRAARLAFFTKK